MDELTKKQQGFVRDYVKTGNGTQSALNNYDTKDYKTASVISTENLDKPSIQLAIKSIAEQIDDSLLFKVHNEGLKASGQVIVNGQVISEKPDYSVRHKYLDTAYKLKGVYAPDRSINLNVNAEITNPKARELAMKYEEELKKGL